MILVADVGGTKGQWLAAGENPIATPGISPVFHSVEEIIAILQQNNELIQLAGKVSRLYYYGTGCSSEERNDRVKSALTAVFANATVQVAHDLMAAAVALYDGRPTIACILGTGSNSCLFDGEKTEEVTPSLGFILGDEGSGAAIGKKLLQDYFYLQMPTAVADSFYKEFAIDKEHAIEHVYRKPNPNTYLGGFARFLALCPDREYISHLVQNEFDTFVRLHVCCYPNAKACSVGFVGSIAYHFQQELKNVLTKYGLTLGKIVRQPIFEMYNYHIARVSK